jgi:hypothetical protein
MNFVGRVLLTPFTLLLLGMPLLPDINPVRSEPRKVVIPEGTYPITILLPDSLPGKVEPGSKVDLIFEINDRTMLRVRGVLVLPTGCLLICPEGPKPKQLNPLTIAVDEEQRLRIRVLQAYATVVRVRLRSPAENTK